MFFYLFYLEIWFNFKHKKKSFQLKLWTRILTKQKDFFLASNRSNSRNKTIGNYFWIHSNELPGKGNRPFHIGINWMQFHVKSLNFSFSFITFPSQSTDSLKHKKFDWISLILLSNNCFNLYFPIITIFPFYKLISFQKLNASTKTSQNFT